MKAPPLLLSFLSIDIYLAAIELAIEDADRIVIAQLYERGLPPIAGLHSLATLFGYSPRFLRAMSIRPEKYYRSFTISSGRKKRDIHAPKVAIKVIQKWFGHYLASAVELNKSVYGFAKGRSFIDAAVVHCNAKWVYSVDIENFFPSISSSQVTNALIKAGYKDNSAELMTRLCCFDGVLAQGSPASPVISNLVFSEIDQNLSLLAVERGIRYSRYADDIVFSGVGDFHDDLKIIVKNEVEAMGWKLAAHKESLAVFPKSLKVHGLLVHGVVPRATKRYRNKIRAYKHLLSAGKVADSDISKFRGHISHSESIG